MSSRHTNAEEQGNLFVVNSMGNQPQRNVHHANIESDSRVRICMPHVIPTNMDPFTPESTSIESSVDTLDSGFSSDHRLHGSHGSHYPILPGEQVMMEIILQGSINDF